MCFYINTFLRDDECESVFFVEGAYYVFLFWDGQGDVSLEERVSNKMEFGQQPIFAFDEKKFIVSQSLLVRPPYPSQNTRAQRKQESQRKSFGFVFLLVELELFKK